jgi:two-component system chemotaxis response regulator CheY
MACLKVMVVDDSLITAKSLIRMLESLGHEVVCTARTGEEAIELYKKFMPDLVTMDISMPDMNGVQATKIIIQEYPDALIVMVTSHGQEEMVLEAVTAGAKGYVLKPLNSERFREHIDNVLKRFRG